jgi:hypothetical protein
MRPGTGPAGGDQLSTMLTSDLYVLGPLVLERGPDRVRKRGGGPGELSSQPSPARDGRRVLLFRASTYNILA